MQCKYKVSAATVNKKGRKNQDNLIVDRVVASVFELSEFDASLTLESRERLLFAVSDGVGGGANGSVASDIAVTVFSKHIEALKNTENTPIQALYNALDEANKAVVDNFFYGKLGGATISGILFDGNRAYVFNIGDSPIYLLRNDSLIRLETSHTLANEKDLAITGQKNTCEENTIVRYLGNREKTGSEQVAVREFEVSTGDIFAVCSDGIEKGLNNREIKQLLTKNNADVAKHLVEKAYQKSEKKLLTDDTTAVVISVTDGKNSRRGFKWKK